MKNRQDTGEEKAGEEKADEEQTGEAKESAACGGGPTEASQGHEEGAGRVRSKLTHDKQNQFSERIKTKLAATHTRQLHYKSFDK